jgi:hypothetical protein
MKNNLSKSVSSSGNGIIQSKNRAYTDPWNTRGGIGCHGRVSIPNWSHPLWALFPRSIHSTTCSQDQCVKNGLTIGMKHIRQHVAQWKVVWVNTIAVTTIKFAKAACKRDSWNPYDINLSVNFVICVTWSTWPSLIITQIKIFKEIYLQKKLKNRGKISDSLNQWLHSHSLSDSLKSLLLFTPKHKWRKKI